MLVAVQVKILRTNRIKTNIEKNQVDSQIKEEIVTHIVDECIILTQKEYKKKM